MNKLDGTISTAMAEGINNASHTSNKFEETISLKEYAFFEDITDRAARKRCNKMGLKKVPGHSGPEYKPPVLFLSPKARVKYYTSLLPKPPENKSTFETCDLPQINDLSIDAELYAKAPNYAKKIADKYTLFCIGEYKDFTGRKLKELLEQFPGTSYQSVMSARQRFKVCGMSGILGRYGHRKGNSIVPDDLFDYFKSLYMVEGSPSVQSCYYCVLGFAKRQDCALDRKNFPSPSAFIRRLDHEIPQEAQYLARNGYDNWNKKFAAYIERDYSGIRAGQCLVADHAQIDIAVQLPNGKICFPWLTAWSDFLSCKFVGWILHCEEPNSDFVFQSFYYAVLKYGLCDEVYLDNGRTFKTKDFANEKRIKVEFDKTRTTTMLSQIGVKVHFALPYGAQAKNIERNFLKIKEALSKHMVGYRGGSVVERPGKLDDEIKAEKIMTFDNFQKLFDDFIINCLNRMPSRGKNHQGKCPDQVWAENFTVKKEIGKDALMLFCMRTTHVLTIGRNGIHDSEIGTNYWAEWMSGRRGEKVYMRRDILDWADAWVFNARNDEYLGNARIGALCAPALAETQIERAELRRALAEKRKSARIIKSYANCEIGVDPVQKVIDSKTGISAFSDDVSEASPKIHTIPDTAMDRVVKRREEIEAEGTADISFMVPPETPKDRLIFDTYDERLIWEREKEKLKQMPLFDSEADRELWLKRNGRKDDADNREMKCA